MKPNLAVGFFIPVKPCPRATRTQRLCRDWIPRRASLRTFAFFSPAGLEEANGFFALVAEGFGAERAVELQTEHRCRMRKAR